MIYFPTFSYELKSGITGLLYFTWLSKSCFFIFITRDVTMLDKNAEMLKSDFRQIFKYKNIKNMSVFVS